MNMYEQQLFILLAEAAEVLEMDGAVLDTVRARDRSRRIQQLINLVSTSKQQTREPDRRLPREVENGVVASVRPKAI